MFSGWYEMAMGKVKPEVEFVSADVRALKDTNTYEMLSRQRDTGLSKTPDARNSQMATPSSPQPILNHERVTSTMTSKSERPVTPDYFGREARYKSPARSFSRPGPPQSLRGSGTASPEWDPTSTQARPFVFPDRNPLNMNKI